MIRHPDGFSKFQQWIKGVYKTDFEIHSQPDPALIQGGLDASALCAFRAEPQKTLKKKLLEDAGRREEARRKAEARTAEEPEEKDDMAFFTEFKKKGEGIEVVTQPQSRKIRFVGIGKSGGWHSGITGPIKCLNGFKARARTIKNPRGNWLSTCVALVTD